MSSLDKTLAANVPLWIVSIDFPLLIELIGLHFGLLCEDKGYPNIWFGFADFYHDKQGIVRGKSNMHR